VLKLCLYILLITAANIANASEEEAFVNPIDICVVSIGDKKINSTKCSYDFNSIEDALAKITEIRRLGNKRQINIYFDSGVYRITKPITMDAEVAVNIAFLGQPDRSTVISASAVVSDLSTVSLRGGGVTALAKKLGIKNYLDYSESGFSKPVTPLPLIVVHNDELLPMARFPNKGYAIIGNVLSAVNGVNFQVIGFNKKKIHDESSVIVAGYFGRDWAFEKRVIKNIDPNNFSIGLDGDRLKFGAISGQRVFIENSFELLDAEGEWFYSRSSDVLYVIPPDGNKDITIEVSSISNIIKLIGAKNVTFFGITFQNTTGDALVFHGGKNVLIENSTIRNVGNRAVFISGENSGLRNVSIKNSGDGGVVLSGGNRKNLTPANLYVENSRIENYATNSKTYRPGVLIYGVGNKVIDSYIGNSEHSAIIFSGNNHLIRGNEITNTNNETTDSGAVYTGRSWSARGTRIENNYFHDIGSRENKNGNMGVYLDDQVGGIYITDNLFVDVNQAVFIGGGRDNYISGNLFINSSPAIHVDGRGMTWQKGMATSATGPLRLSLDEVPWDGEIYTKQYPRIAEILTDDIGSPKYNHLVNNYSITSNPLRTMDGAEKFINIEKYLISDSELHNCDKQLLQYLLLKFDKLPVNRIRGCYGFRLYK